MEFNSGFKGLKIGKIFTLYQRELFKKIPRLGTFCTQSVNLGLSKNLLLLSSGSKLYGTVVRAKDPTHSDHMSLQDVFHQSLSDDFSFRSSRPIAIGCFT